MLRRPSPVPALEPDAGTTVAGTVDRTIGAYRTLIKNLRAVEIVSGLKAGDEVIVSGS